MDDSWVAVDLKKILSKQQQSKEKKKPRHYYEIFQNLKTKIYSN